MKCQDMKIIVTGAGRGIGREFCQKLSQSGAQVFGGDIDMDGLAETAKSLKSSKGTFAFKQLDVALEESVTSFVDWADQKAGGINGVVSNAGILDDGLLVKKDRHTGEIIKMPTSKWQRVLDINLTGATLVIRETVAKMMERNTQGIVVSMSSLARHGNRGQSSYVAAKAALAANTVTWAREFGKYDIRVGAIAPGMVETPMTAAMNPKAKSALMSAIPCGRIGQPEDIWLGLKFIIECDYFTGRVLDIDGGLGM